MNSDQMFEEFRLWFKGNERKLKGEPLFAKIRRSEMEDETLTPPLYTTGIDLKTEDVLASFGVWATGNVSVIIMSNRTGKELIVDDRRIQTPSELHPILDHYCNALVSRGPFERAPIT